jgi:LysM repeat protein
MNRDDENEEIIPRPPTGGQRRPVKTRADRSRQRDLSGSSMARNPLGRDTLSHSKPSLIVPLPEPPLPRGPSYPAWERPPTHRDYPLLRGQEQHRALWPLIAVGLAVSMVLIILVVIPTVMGNGRSNVAGVSPSTTTTTTAHVSGSAKPVTSGSVRPTVSVKPTGTQGPTGTPGPTVSYTQYKVVAGDTATGIARKFGLKTWELLLANPQLGPSGLVKLGQVLNIPQPGVLTPPPAATPTPTDTPVGG